jgi:hypothetical protein
MRRIILDPQEFCERLSDLSFVEKDGLWIPPTGIATGAVKPMDAGHIIHAEEDDLIVQLHVARSNGTRLLVLGAPIRSPITWLAIPDGAIVFRDGRLVTGFDCYARIVEPEHPLVRSVRSSFARTRA